MAERRHPKVKIGRRKSDIPVKALEQFKNEIKAHVDEAVDKGIEKHVNGGIRHLKEELDNYIKGDMAWKKRAEPLVVAFESSRWGFRAFATVMKFFGLFVPFYGGYLLIKNFWK